MSNDENLARKINTLVAKDDYDGKALRLGASGQPDAMKHVLQAIDDTMMLRLAVFSVGDSAVTLRISGKRLLSMVAATDDLSVPEGLIDLPLSKDTPDAVAQVADVLHNLLAIKGTLSLERIPAKAEAKQSGSGVGIQALNASWSKAHVGDESDPMAAFITACLPHAAALITETDGATEVVAGDQLEVELLQGVCGSKWASIGNTHRGNIPAGRENSLHILDALGPENYIFVAAKIKEKQCFALISMTKITVVPTAWADAFSPS